LCRPLDVRPGRVRHLLSYERERADTVQYEAKRRLPRWRGRQRVREQPAELLRRLRRRGLRERGGRERKQSAGV